MTVESVDLAIVGAGPAGLSAAAAASGGGLRTVLIDERGADRRYVRAHGYWRQGAAAVHDDFDI